jgi:preprotein translocase subunit YajC
MKWVFFFLLLGNLGMFLLIYPQQKTEELSGADDVGKLMLTSEISTSSLEAPAIQRTEEAPGTLNEEGIEQRTQPTDDEEMPPDETPSLEGSQQPISATGQIPQRSVQGTQSQQESVTSEEQTVMRCGMVGYVKTRIAAEEILVKLRAFGLAPEIQTKIRKEQTGYWALIPPRKTRQAAIEMTKKLQRSGVTDVWRFTSGELAHAVSLGLFRDMERASIRKREIEALGFGAKVQPRYRETTEYWVSYRAKGLSPLTTKDENQLSNDYPGLVLSYGACP